YKNPKLKFNLDLARPPYKSKMPDYFPTEEDVNKFELEDENPEIKNNNGRMNNMISYSVLHWDFGRYEVDSNLSHFYSVPFTFDEEFKIYLKTLNKKQRSILKTYNSILQIQSKYLKNKYRVSDKLLENIEDFINRIIEQIKIEFSELEIKNLEKNILPFIEKKYSRENGCYINSIEKNPVKRWIVKRVFELGYDYKIHGSYDNSVEIFNDRSENKIERIGKKYQWIALFEILASITDNYKIYDDWSEKQSFYKGPWQLYSRDIDPAFTRRIIDENEEENEINNELRIKDWSDIPPYNNWVQNDIDWVENLIDLPSINSIINIIDNQSIEWLVLERSIKWRQPKPIGEEKYFGRRKEVSFFLQAYLI